MLTSANAAVTWPASLGRLAPAAPVLIQAERATLRRLRARYRAGGDRPDARELARLRFIRWLHQTGRLAS
jgi:hypothetical protein